MDQILYSMFLIGSGIMIAILGIAIFLSYLK